MNKQVAQFFESGFLSESLAKQIDQCDGYELAPLFLRVFNDKQPVLEAGCGTGRWCGWLLKHGIQSDGLDWSKELCDRASREIPQSKFIPCDMQNTPLPDGAYGGILALGSVEHTATGPQGALAEFHRLLRPDGVAVITVPYGGNLRVVMRFLGRPLLHVKSWGFIRRRFGKSVGETGLAQARRGTRREWHPRFAYGSDGWYFHEYEFNKSQMRRFLAQAGFEVLEEFVGFGDEGISHNFGRLAGRWSKERCGVRFTILGRILRKILPVTVMGHMLCYVVAKKPSNRQVMGDSPPPAAGQS
jgi:SAM-dependent methyltransferase